MSQVISAPHLGKEELKMSEQERINLDYIIAKFAVQEPVNIDKEQLRSQVKEMINLAKIKGLTVRQAQLLFQICSEYILESTLI